jgi:hypothetical protein
MLREGIESQFQAGDDEFEPSGRVARRKAGYANAIGERSNWKDRLTDDIEEMPVAERLRALA